MPGSRKAERKLAERVSAWNSHGERPTSQGNPGKAGMQLHKPGSQNRNK
jgi:hypothetical protein